MNNPKCLKRGYHSLGIPKWITAERYVRMCRICEYVYDGKISVTDENNRITVDNSNTPVVKLPS